MESIKTYISAEWNVEVCSSGENGTINSYYPLGSGMKKNMILDHFLKSTIYAFSPSGGAVKPYSKTLNLAGLARGIMQIGSGTGIVTPYQTELFRPVKSTSYIRPFFNECTGIYYPELGSATISKKYDFPIETGVITYTEGGFVSDFSGILPASVRSHLWSKFLFTQETDVSGFLYSLNDGTAFFNGTGISGVYANNTNYILPEISSPLYKGFSEIPSFEYGWKYTWPKNSGMFLLNENGATTGFVASPQTINGLSVDGYITGIIGYKNILSPITLSGGDFLKLRYDITMTIPAIVDPIQVTGESVINGEFNGSGELKLIGQFSEIFGAIDGDGKSINKPQGIWWPVHKVRIGELSAQAAEQSPYPEYHLSAAMVDTGRFFQNTLWANTGFVLGNPTGFPPIDSGIPIITTWLDTEDRIVQETSILLGECGGQGTAFRAYDMQYYSQSLLTPNNRTPASYRLSGMSAWPLYYHNTLFVENYLAPNNSISTSGWPNSLNIKMIFPGQYPNRDTGFAGFLIAPSIEGNAVGGKSLFYNDVEYSSVQFLKPTIYENAKPYIDCKLPRRYSAWYYRFNNAQTKYEDQTINLFLSFSINRL